MLNSQRREEFCRRIRMRDGNRDSGIEKRGRMRDRYML
jgi:hypothetical protein